VHVIQDACVIPMRGEGETRLPHHDVIVRDGLIEAVQPTGGSFSEDATVIDGQGRFATPGLIDTHVHYYYPDDEDTEEFDLDALNKTWAMLSLLNGVTSTLCLCGWPGVLELRDQVVAGTLEGPTIYSSGPGQNDPEQTARGYDMVKVYSDVPADAYRGIMEEAREQGLRVVGHVPASMRLDGVLAAGQASIVHAEEICYGAFDFRTRRAQYDWIEDPPLKLDQIRRICAQIAEAGVVVMPLLSPYHAICQQAENTFAWHRSLPEFELLDPQLVHYWTHPPDGRYVQQFIAPWTRRNLVEHYWFQMRITDELHRAGVTITAGTDWGVPGVIPGLLPLELSSLAVAGLDNDGALRAGTQGAGEFLEPGSGLGTLTPGTRADVLLLDADPLEDVRNVRSIRGVMVRGRWYGRDELDARREALHETAQASQAAASD
jgi:imidazolonepropionase-like amidohydrolase